MDFSSALALHPPTADLVLRGELDAWAARQLRQRLDEAIDSGCLNFAIDASAVTFLDAGGIGTLVWLLNTVAPYDGTVAVVAASLRVRQIAELTGLDAALGVDLLPLPLTASTDPFTPYVARHSAAVTRPSATAPRCGARQVRGWSTGRKRAGG